MKRELVRSREVGEILARNGLRALAVSAGLAPRKRGTDQDDVPFSLQHTRPDMLVAALTELGTAWIKLGQVLSTRRDLLPAEYCDALETLTDHTPPVPFSVIRSAVESALDTRLESSFEHVDPHALGSASIAQVHAARTRPPASADRPGGTTGTGKPGESDGFGGSVDVGETPPSGGVSRPGLGNTTSRNAATHGNADDLDEPGSSAEQTDAPEPGLKPPAAAPLRDVVIKVRKPGVLENVTADLDIMERLVHALCRTLPELEELGVLDTVHAFSATMRAELDFDHEAAVCEEMAARFADNTMVHVPAIDRSRTTNEVLTQERVMGGIRLDNLAALKAAGLDPDEIGHRYIDALLEMVFSFGRFHADPHGGNVFVHPDGSLTFLDWGMVGTIDTATRRALLRLMIGFSLPHEGLLISALLDLAQPRRHLDRAQLRRDVGDLVRTLRDNPLAQQSATDVGNTVLRIVHAHRLRLDPAIPVVLRCLGVAEGLTRRLSPEMSLPAVAAKHARASMLRELRPDVLAEQITERLGDAIVFGHDVPARLSRVLDALESGETEMGYREDTWTRIRRQRDKENRRLVGGMLASAGMIASSITWAAWYSRRGK